MSDIETPPEPSHQIKPAKNVIRMAMLACLLFLIAISMSAYSIGMHQTAAVPTEITAALASLTEQQKQLAQELAQLKLAPPPLDINAPQLAQLKVRIEQLERRPITDSTPIDGLIGRLDAVETTQKQFQKTTALPTSNAYIMQLAALNGFEQAIISRRPYAAQLAQFQAAFPNIAITPVLNEFAATGLPDDLNILTELKTSRAKFIDHIAPAPQGWDEAILRSISRWLVIEKSGSLISSPIAIADQLERAVQNRNWGRVQQIWSTVPAAPQADMPNLQATLAALTAAQILTDKAWQIVNAPKASQ